MAATRIDGPTASPPTGGMVPPEALRPDVLPSERLLAAGMPVPGLRRRLRAVPDGRNAVTVVSALAQSVGVLAVAAAWPSPWLWAAAFVLLCRGFVLLSVLAHEGAHRLLFTNRRANDLVGRWLLGHPAFVAFDLYRRSHLTHHRDELGPEEPDPWLYGGYPVERATFRRRLTRDVLGISGWKRLRMLGVALRHRSSRPHALGIVVGQLPVLALVTLLGHPEAYVALWLLPWMTGWQVLNRLRAVAEHGGLEPSDDKRATTHVVRQRPLARFWLVPYNTGYHLAHHVDMGVPFRNLPRLHAELERAGYVPDEIEYPDYRSLWRALVGGPRVPLTSPVAA